MAVGEDGMVGDHDSTSKNGSASEVDSTSTSSNAGNSSTGFASGVLPGVREASRKLQLKMNFRTLASPKRHDTDRVVLTEARPARSTKYLELDGSDVSADEADVGDVDWPSSMTGAWPTMPSSANKSPPSPAAPASPQGTSPPASAAPSSWKDKMVRRRHDSGSSKNGKKDKNEPSRFMGEGVSFKAKLIGILEVAEARGDRMCQDALADLKMAIRAAGEHKQRITINIAIDGLRLRDEKTGDCLYHHLVHKISFIAQDMTDPRAFGYIFGSPDTGHRFFGIKTDKAASQVVECIRDLFQVVFALKNREQHIEQQHLKICGSSTSSLMSTTTTTPSVTYMEAMAHHLKESCVRENGSPGAVASSSKAESEATIADLLDLEYELNNLQQNIHQMDQITAAAAKEDVFDHDPFGDSFTATTTKTTTTKTATSTAVAPLPPPPSAKDAVRPDGTGTHRRERTVNRAGSTTSTTTATVSVASTAFTPTAASFGAAAPGPLSAPLAQEEKHWFDQETEALFDDSDMPGSMSKTNQLDHDSNRASPLEMGRQTNLLADQFDVFTELDPLGTGRSKPYVDKKDFFSDLKNPPKKVLKDLVGEVDPLSAPAPLFQASFDSGRF
ncbi:Protein disabled [Frankliniella fusca]|uniref:Protein disabled n=1 Tax=Frankliniella fusca TaxID=407009 RepID=A0AAE1LZ30_9NEOP|nr:Protein disabled [Frankliniella fusca]